MFEVCLKRPTHWPPLNTGNPHGTDTGTLCFFTLGNFEQFIILNNDFFVVGVYLSLAKAS